MDQSFDNSNTDMDIDSLSEPMSFAMGGPVESMHLTPYVPTNQESGDYQDSHSMPQNYAHGGEVEEENGNDQYTVGDYGRTRPEHQNMARQMLQSFADGGSVQGRALGGRFDLGPTVAPGMSTGMTYAMAPGGIGQTKYNQNISDFVTANIHQRPGAIPAEAQKYGVSPQDVTAALGGQTLESRFRAEPAYQTRQVTDTGGVTRTQEAYGPATMLTGGTGSGFNWVAPTVTSRPRTLIEATPGLSASQVNARNLAAGDSGKAVISDLYQSVLGRAPDPGGLAYWMSTIGSDSVISPNEIANFQQAASAELAKRATALPAPKGLNMPLEYNPVKAQDTVAKPEYWAHGGEVKKKGAAKLLEDFVKKPDGAASARMTAPVRRAEGSQIEGEVSEPRSTEKEPRSSAVETMKKLGLSVARGVPQMATGLVDIAALPFTMSGMVQPENVVASTAYLTKRGLLPPPQPGVVNETTELLGSALSPAGATKAAMLGMVGPAGIIGAARRSSLFKGPGLQVPSGEMTSAELLKALKEQGIDVDRTWLRGKKGSATAPTKQIPQDTLEYIYESVQKRPDAQEAALRDAIRSQSIDARTLSRQPGDRSATKYNTTGGVWLTESPRIAETYTGDKGYMIPVYAAKPGAVLDAKGQQWDDYYRGSKEWLEAKADPNIRSIEVRNVIDPGPYWTSTLPENLTDEQILENLKAANLFLKKPFNDRVVNKLTGEPFKFKHGGEATSAFIQKSNARR